MPKRVAAERDRLRRQIRNLRKDGLSDRAIERTLGLSQGWICQHIGRRNVANKSNEFVADKSNASWTFPPLPTGPYRCIVIDPPWPMSRIPRDLYPGERKTLDYPVMGIEQIAALGVPKLIDQEQGCHVYLWVTQRFLEDGLRLFKHWGVTYQCVMTWVKNIGMVPYSWMYDTEHVLFGNSRGRVRLARIGQRLSFAAPVNGHSVKPDVFYERVRAASFEPRLEMFTRGPHEGFEAWGNEVAYARDMD